MDEKPHVVCVPYPAQGHINPVLRLAKLLYIKAFHITFVNTEYNHNRLLRSRCKNSLDGLPSFRFESIPDGLPPADIDDVTHDLTTLVISMEITSGGPFRELLSRLNDTATSGVPTVSCIIADAAIGFTSGTGKELGIPEVIMFAASACAFRGISQFKNLALLKNPSDELIP